MNVSVKYGMAAFALAVLLAALIAAAPKQAAAPAASLTVFARGVDQTAELQAVYDQAMDGDTITLRPLNGVKRFYHSAALSWTGTKNISVEATGTELYGQFAISGTQATVTWGGSPGSRVSNVHWNGGVILGALAVQNVSYCKHIDPDSVSTLIVQSDTVCAYNDFHISGMNGGTGLGSALIYNQLNATAWCNCNSFHGCSMSGTSINGVASPVIVATNKTATWQPSVQHFNECRFEGANQIMFNVGNQFNCVFTKPYFEGDWQPGTGGGMECFTFDCMPIKIADWLKDPGYRFIQYGVMQ